MLRFLPFLLGLLWHIETAAQFPTCQLRMYESYADYQLDRYTCWEIVSFRSFFNGQLRLKAKGQHGVEKIIKENYWGCYLQYEGPDSLRINQLFRFSRDTGAPLAYQESGEGYALFFQLLRQYRKPLKVISRDLQPTDQVYDFHDPDADGVRIVLGRKANGQKTSKAERKKIRKAIQAIQPSAEILKLRALLALE